MDLALRGRIANDRQILANCRGGECAPTLGMSGLLGCIRRHSCLPHNYQVRLMNRVAVRRPAMKAEPDSLAFLY